MKRLKKGFTLIELLVVIAIIGILATTLAPKLREQLAKAKDSKAIAILGAARTGVSILSLDKMVQATGTTMASIKYAEILGKLDNKAQKLITSGDIAIGGSRTASDSATLVYGGNVTFAGATTTTTTSAALATNGVILVTDDGAELYLKAKTGGTTVSHSTEGKAWLDY